MEVVPNAPLETWVLPQILSFIHLNFGPLRVDTVTTNRNQAAPNEHWYFTELTN